MNRLNNNFSRQGGQSRPPRAFLGYSHCLYLGQTLEIQKPSDHQGFLPHIFQGSPKESPESMFFFGFSPKLFDLLSCALTPLIRTPALSHAHSCMLFVRSTGMTRNVRFDPSTEQSTDKFLLKNPLSPPTVVGLSFNLHRARSSNFKTPWRSAAGPSVASQRQFPPKSGDGSP